MGAVTLILTMIVWWRDVIREATFQGLHTMIVKQGLTDQQMRTLLEVI